MWRRPGLALLSPFHAARFVHARRLGNRLGLQGYQTNHLRRSDGMSGGALRHPVASFRYTGCRRNR